MTQDFSWKFSGKFIIDAAGFTVGWANSNKEAREIVRLHNQAVAQMADRTPKS